MTEQTNLAKSWRIVGASAIGTSHTKSGAPCQDSFAYKHLPNKGLIIAVADGAGSAPKSDQGSRLIADTAVESLAQQLDSSPPTDEEGWQTAVKTAFGTAQQAVSDQLDDDESTMRDYAATLMLVALTPDWTVGGLVGDSVAVVMDADEVLTILCTPQKGEYANMTNFLTQDNALDMLDVEVSAGGGIGVAVFSDGLQSLAINIAQNKPHVPFFKPLFAFTAAVEDKDEVDAAKQLAEFLNTDRLNERTDDDKTLVLAKQI
ncbi:PP2C family serine/threonine-protein phosphatase [Anaerolineales bacterium HSG25]|nr:PP2C family serine/threonine-protein phosphatase [Anaerolineales bacterium HSG25]